MTTSSTTPISEDACPVPDPVETYYHERAARYFKATPEHIIVAVEEPAPLPGGLVRPDTAVPDGEPTIGRIVSVGAGCPPEFAVGRMVLASAFGGETLPGTDAPELRSLRGADVVALTSEQVVDRG